MPCACSTCLQPLLRLRLASSVRFSRPVSPSCHARATQRSEATNLLSVSAPSVTHVGMSSLRMEPQFMVIGQAAGVAASLAIKRQDDEHKKRQYRAPPPDKQSKGTIEEGAAIDLHELSRGALHATLRRDGAKLWSPTINVRQLVWGRYK